MQIIKPGTSIDFMGVRRTFGAVSIVAVVVSLVALLIFGLNFGVDFKGGSVVIVGFKKDASLNREDIKAAVAAKVGPILGKKDADVVVQDFDIGGLTTSHEVKYQLYTEVTSLLNEDKIAAIMAAVKADFGAETRVESPEESDKFYVSLTQEAAVLDTRASLQALFAKQGYEDIKIRSDREEEIDIDFYKELNLREAETKKAGEDVEDLLLTQVREFEEHKNKELLPGLRDAKYTVTILELNGLFEDALKDRFGDAFIGIESSTAVSASVGSEIFFEGMLALFYAIIGMLIYISIRFDVRFAPGAVVALIHDAAITMGIFAIFQIKFSLPIVAALLTIIGYSLNDTIVVFDRIRENMEKVKGEVSERIINKSVNETLSRTLLTSGTTLFVVLSVLILGGGMIKNFALALTIGVVVGTYSSVFVASPVAYLVEQFLLKRAEKS